MRRGPRLVDILLRTGLVDDEVLQRARSRQERRGGTLLESLVLGGCSEADLARALSSALRLPVVSLRGKRIDPEVLELVPRDLAEKYGCLPLFSKIEQGMSTLYLGVEDPTDQAVLDEVSFQVGLRVRPVVVGPIQLRAAQRVCYPEPTEAERLPGPTPRQALTEAPIVQDDTAPVLVSSLAAAAEGTEPEPSFESRSSGSSQRARPRDVPTRTILRALLQVLIEKEIVTRGELLAAVDEVRSRTGGEDGGD